jgi:hypothetical protein
VLAGLTAASVAATTLSVLTAGTAFAAVPTAPDNLLVFPNRDFITIEGYQSHAGEVATIELTRAGKVVGSAQGTVSGGDVAFEVNHPGGVCWGAGTGVNVTPDIVPGDTVTIKFGGTAFGDTTVQSAGWANDPAGVPTPTMTLESSPAAANDTLVVKGTIGATDAPTADNMEQRIVNADGFRTNLGKRDIRAVPGGLTPAPKTGTSSYSSSLVSDGTSFTATYVFTDPAVAQIAKGGGGQRLLQWQQVDAAANRQGVTIAEAGEVGGPGFGGCPAGPASAAAPAAGSASVIRSADKASAKVNWTAATAAPGATPVSGYSVEAIATTANAAGEKPGTLIRTGAAATSTTLANLDPAVTYDIEVRSIAGTGLSAPYTIGAVAGTPTGAPKDTVIPTLTVTPAGGATEAAATAATSVTATSDNGQIFYTDDGSLAVFGDGPSATAKLYTGPVAITKATNLSFAAFDTAGNIAKPAQDGWYAPDATSTGLLAAPANLKATSGQGQVTLAWDAVPTATGYQVVVYDNAAVPAKIATQPPANTGTSQVITLPTGTYQFAVQTKNTAGNLGTESAKVTGSSTTATDTITITRPVWKTNDFRVVGSSSASSGTVSVYTVDPVANPTARPVTGMADQPLTAAVAPATGSTFDIRLRNTTGLTKPATVWVKSSNGGVRSSTVG